jgi:hypothetical protein
MVLPCLELALLLDAEGVPKMMSQISSQSGDIFSCSKLTSKPVSIDWHLYPRQ